MAPGPFARNGMTPASLGVGRVTRLEAAREVVAYLEAEGVLDGVSWEALGVPDRDTWVKGITEVYADAGKKAAKAAMAELAEYEELALLLHCQRCGADEEEPCRDLRRNVIVHIKHPHAERTADIEGA